MRRMVTLLAVVINQWRLILLGSPRTSMREGQGGSKTFAWPKKILRSTSTYRHTRRWRWRPREACGVRRLAADFPGLGGFVRAPGGSSFTTFPIVKPVLRRHD